MVWTWRSAGDGTYVMTAAEAANACGILRPKLAIPMHYGAIVGSAADAEAFRKGRGLPSRDSDAGA